MTSHVVVICQPKANTSLHACLGDSSRGYQCSRFWVKTMLQSNEIPFSFKKSSLNIKGKKSNDFLKGRTNHVQFLGIFRRNKGETFQVAILFHPNYPETRSQMNYTFRKLVE